MEFRVLGKLEVIRDGHSIDIGAFRQRALLALLLTAPNSVFSTDKILNELWGVDGGLDKQNALWVYVSGLRKALEPGREKRAEGSVLLTRAPGYLVQAEPDAIDSVRFGRMVAEGRALACADPAAASLVLGESLALWRGRAFEDFTYEPFAQAEIARLEELRLEAVELRVDADLERGLARELVSELESLVRHHPLNERFAGQLMLALYRSSRQGDSLRAYQLLKSRLGDELGIEPSSWLRKLEEQIVTADAALEVRSREAAPAFLTAPGLAIRGYELREQIGDDSSGSAFRAYQPSIGREVAIKVIRPELANDPDFIRRFTADASLIATLEHPHIVPLYDFWREPDAAYLVTRLMRGGNLTVTLEQGPLTAARTLIMIDQLGAALQVAHRSGVVHGDINSDIVLLDDDGNAYLSEFGIVGGGDTADEADISGLGILVAQSLAGCRAGVDDVRAVPDSVARVIDRATNRDAGQPYRNVADLVADLHEALSEDTNRAQPATIERAAAIDNPYKGLRAFDTVDAVDFFGRERLVERLVARLGGRGTRGRFIAVVGPSGSGKSSAVKAGLLPAIRQGAVPLSGSWFTVVMTPAPHPFEQLEEALVGVAIKSGPSILGQLVGDDGVRRVLDRVLPHDGSQLLLLIDQFEELFTQVDSASADRFMASIVSAVTDPRSRVRVVVTLRADFYDRPLQHRGFGELLREATDVMTPMSAHDLERAITAPAERRGVTFEPALVAELLREVIDRPGALPLLQYTLTELFESRRGQRVTHAAYDELGGVSGALVKRAEGLLASLGNDADEVARQVFLRLVTLTEGGEDTRRRVLQSELEALDVDRQLLHSVLETFGRHRLLSFDRDPVTRSPTVEISHEALLTQWIRLRDWVDGARHDVRVQRRIEEALREWVEADRADSYLLTGGLLEQMHGWSTTTSLQLSGPERAFLDASIAARDREAEESRRREHRAAEAERRQKQRGRQLVGVGLVALLVTAVGSFGAVQWRSAADAKRDVDNLLIVNRLVTASRASLDKNPQLALLLAMQSLRQTVGLGYATQEAVDSVHFALQELGVQYDVAQGTPVAARPGSQGLVGVYALAPNELMDLAESTALRAFTNDECQAFLAGPCPLRRDIPDDLPLRGGLAAYGADTGLAPLAGTTVTISPGGLDLDSGLLDEFVAFEKRTGIHLEVARMSAENARSFEASEPRNRPDIWIFQHEIPAWVHNRAMDVGQFIAPETLTSDFGEYTLSFGTLDGLSGGRVGNGPVRAIPLLLQVKGLVFYPKAAFERAGYRIPRTWDELLALSDRIVSDGATPWCFGFEHGSASGWPGTDFLESLVIRVGGVDSYDAWTRGDIRFASPEVSEAGRLANDLIFKPKYVRGGPGRISNENFANQLDFVLHRDSITGQAQPACWMYHQADFALGWVPATTQIGTDIDFFLLPPIDPTKQTPVTGGAHFAAALADRPEVRAFMQFLASPEWGKRWATEPGDQFISPNRRFDLSNYGDATADPAVAVRTRLVEVAQSALQSDAFRMDASDLMPQDIGGATTDDKPGAFWRGMIDWVNGTRSIDQVFTDIDAAWDNLKAHR